MSGDADEESETCDEDADGLSSLVELFLAGAFFFGGTPSGQVH